MTVSDLIEKLQMEDPDAIVRIQFEELDAEENKVFLTDAPLGSVVSDNGIVMLLEGDYD